MKNFFLSIILFFALTSFSIEGASGKLRFSHLTNKEGLPSNSVFSITQDYKGYYWFGTKAGLCRYDGSSIVRYGFQYNDSASLPGNLVHCVFEDSKNNLWVSTITGIAIYDRDNNNFKVINRDLIVRNIAETAEGRIFAASTTGLKVFDSLKNDFVSFLGEDKFEIKDFCNDVVTDKNNNIWVATTNGLYVVNLRNYSVSNYKNNPQNNNSLISNRIFDLFIDKSNRLWVGTEDKGLCYFNKNTGTFHSISGLSNGFVHCITVDEKGQMWIGTEWGLNIYSPSTNSLTIHTQNPLEKSGINDNAVHSIYFDKYQNMLIGTYFGGVNLSLKLYQQFHIYESGNPPGGMSGKAVRQIIGDENNNLWIATEDGGLNFFDSQKGLFKAYKHNASGNSLSYNNVHAVMLDKDNELWIGTFLGGLNKLNIANQRFTLYNKAKYPVFNIDNFFAALQDKDGLFWFATTNGILTYDKNLNTFQQFESEILQDETINVLMEDSEGNIWIGTRNLGAYKYNKKLNNLKNYRPGKGNSISDYFINYIYEDHKKNIWIATHNNGLNLLNTKEDSITIFRADNGLPSNTVFAVLQDDDNNLWISTNDGLSKYDIEQGTFYNFTVQEGLPNNQFNYNSALKDKNGRLYFGTIDGLISFNPKELKIPVSTERIDITDFKIMGRSVTPNTPNSPLKQSIGETRDIVLTSEQAKFISFEFTLPTLLYSQNLSFEMKMQNNGQDWINLGAQRQVSFSNLSPGDYTFMIKVADESDSNNTSVRTISIKVLPPFWRSTLAYIFYTFLLLLIIYLYNRYINNKQEAERQSIREKNEKERIKEINRLKLNFFTNISHELNTPLTLIISPIQNMLTQFNLSDELKEKMVMIKRNADKMKLLIEELISLGKIETEEEKISLKEGYALRFILELVEGFRPWAELKNIHFSTDITVAKHPVYFDSLKVEKIVYNILSNAFKYTDPQGEIKLSAGYFFDNDIQMLKIEIVDTGKGISKENLSKIFEKYYQINDQNNSSGFGIGLNLARQLADIHKGSIEVQSEVGKGSTFTVILNVDESSYLPHEKSSHKLNNEHISTYSYLTPETVEHELLVHGQKKIDGEKTEDKPYLLIVEDNEDLLNFIGSVFEKEYKIKMCADGKEAYRVALETIPDLIISDLMMPELDGLELCKLIKTSIETCHIPFIMLTAKISDENVSEGYEHGADFYIKKPFNAAVLLQQVKNILNTVENQRNYFKENTDLVFQSTKINTRDKKFLESINALIMENLSVENYSIISLTKDLGVSRTLLHSKLKSIMGLSATEYVNKIKLKEGLKLLQEGNNISEVSYLTGFASPSYFSRCFKKEYGVSPRDFMKRS